MTTKLYSPADHASTDAECAERSASRVSLRPVRSLQEFETLRQIRNECREYMTRYRDEISREAQRRWRQTIGPDILPFLAFVDDEIIGYGLVHRCTDGDWITGALTTKHRGRGLGNILFKELIAKCRATPKLEVLKTNERAVRLYSSLGFKVTTETGEILIMSR